MKSQIIKVVNPCEALPSKIDMANSNDGFFKKLVDLVPKLSVIDQIVENRIASLEPHPKVLLVPDKRVQGVFGSIVESERKW